MGSPATALFTSPNSIRPGSAHGVGLGSGVGREVGKGEGEAITVSPTRAGMGEAAGTLVGESGVACLPVSVGIGGVLTEAAATGSAGAAGVGMSRRGAQPAANKMAVRKRGRSRGMMRLRETP